MKKSIYILATTLVAATAAQAQNYGFSDPSRTEYRDDAGASGPDAKSGFFQSVNPVNFPTGASGWWHLLDVRHANPVNNYAMQFSGSFYDQDLYFRKTGNSTSQPWRKVVTTAYDGHIEAPSIFSTQFTVSQGGQSDKVNDVTWYGLGRSNMVLPSASAANATSVQLAGYFGLNLKTNRGDLVMLDNGNVGIGTLNPTSKLSVDGVVQAREVKVTVEQNDWADYVFHKDYRLMSLDSLSVKIRELGHLPGIPSAAEVSRGGLNLGEMNKKLLEKVEELTIYMLDLKKQNDELNKENAAIKARMDRLEAVQKPQQGKF